MPGESSGGMEIERIEDRDRSDQFFQLFLGYTAGPENDAA